MPPPYARAAAAPNANMMGYTLTSTAAGQSMLAVEAMLVRALGPQIGGSVDYWGGWTVTSAGYALTAAWTRPYVVHTGNNKGWIWRHIEQPILRATGTPIIYR
jgi:hypothetical protein